ncbi:exopolysaccharide phosphotransferase cps2G [Bacteroidia bacterium]|nr:exopolysaccharide phosphotransferase cps2G [Bacteroidia bacterium]
MDIDLVYLWCDGNDNKWLARKNALMNKKTLTRDVTCRGRHANNNELQYSLRSVGKYVPWIRQIFIVVDNQIPDFININNHKIKLIDIRDILPPEALPCYNSVVIEYFLYKIPDLSEHFLYANDDMFFNAPVSPNFFFTKDNYPIVRLLNKPLGKWRYRWKTLIKKPLSTYRQSIWNAALLVEKKFGKFYSGIPHHNIDAYRKSDLKRVVNREFAIEIADVVTHHCRTSSDIQRAVFLYYALAVGHGQLKYVKKNESCVIGLYKKNYFRYLNRYKPTLLCMNDDDRANENDRLRTKTFLETIFSQKSVFEK